MQASCNKIRFFGYVTISFFKDLFLRIHQALCVRFTATLIRSTFRGTIKKHLLWILEKTSNDLDPDFNWSLISLSRFFRPSWGDLRKKKRSSPEFKRFFRPKLRNLLKKKKKVFTQIQSLFLTNFREDPKQKLQFCGVNHSKSFTTSDCQSRWGDTF